MGRSSMYWAGGLLGAIALLAGMALAPSPPAAPTPPSVEPREAPETISQLSITGCEELGVVSAQLQSSYRTALLSSFELRVSPEGELHVSEDFPTFVQLTSSPGVSLVDAELGPERARTTEDGLAFDVAFRASRPGAHDVDVRVDYALCSDDACIPATCTFQVHLESAAA